MAGLGDLGRNRQGNGVNQHPRCVVLVKLLPHDDGLRSLRDDGQARQAKAMYALPVGSGRATDVQSGNTQLKTAIMRSIGGEHACQLVHVWFTWVPGVARQPRMRVFVSSGHSIENLSMAVMVAIIV